MKTPTLLVVLAVLGISCSPLTTKTDMVFDPLPEGPATFDLVQKTVFNGSCALSGCHRNNVAPDLSAGRSYAGIVNVRSSRRMALVEPGDADNSYLYLKIIADAEISGSPHASRWTIPYRRGNRTGARLDRTGRARRLIGIRAARLPP